MSPKLRRVLTLLSLLAAALLAPAAPAFAEDPIGEFFGGLFGGGDHVRQRPAPRSAPRVRRILPHQENRGPTYWRGGEERARRGGAPKSDDGGAGQSETPSETASPANGTEPTPSGDAKPAPTFHVAILGDTMATLLANGLPETLSDTPDIAIDKLSKASSGLVRDDFYDWPKAAREIANGPGKVDVAVIMVGINDRQQIRQGSDTEDPMTPRWRELYTARVDAMMAPFREKKIPVVWVGLPVMKSETFSADMAKLNDIYKERTSRADAVFVDLWDSFSDEKGQYSAFGPDINGQIVKIRAADGVHFTPTGAVSVAHFVAEEIKKLYGARKPAPIAARPEASPAAPTQPTATGPAIEFRPPVAAPATTAPSLADRPAIGPVQALDAPVAAAGVQLARRSASDLSAMTEAQDASAKALARHVFVQGGDQPARRNRADDAAWGAQAAAPAAAPPPPVAPTPAAAAPVAPPAPSPAKQ